jgi:uncharacterized protein YbcI
MDTKSITITDETILSYYRANPHVDIVAMNIMLIDILKSLSTNLSATINSTVTSKILSIVSDIDKNISSFRSDIIATFNEKLNQTRKEYVEDLKTQLTNNILSNIALRLFVPPLNKILRNCLKQIIRMKILQKLL